MSRNISLNINVLKIVEKIVKLKDELCITIEKTPEGITVIDAGLFAQGGYKAGKYITEICMGGLGEASLDVMAYEDFYLPTISVITDFPALALLGSQLAGWRINIGKFFALASGPARAIAQKPKDLYQKIEYKDKAESATIVLEASDKPSKEVLEYILSTCNVKPEKLTLIIVPASSIAGSTQISGRIAETGLHRLTNIGLDPKSVLQAAGYAPIAPIHPDSSRTIGRANDMILYGGFAYFNVVYDDDLKLKELVDASSSLKSKDYGRPFIQILQEVNNDFYKIDQSLFAPAMIMVNNIKTGKSFRAGKIDAEILKQSINT